MLRTIITVYIIYCIRISQRYHILCLNENKTLKVTKEKSKIIMLLRPNQ